MSRSEPDGETVYVAYSNRDGDRIPEKVFLTLDAALDYKEREDYIYDVMGCQFVWE